MKRSHLKTIAAAAAIAAPLALGVPAAGALDFGSANIGRPGADAPTAERPGADVPTSPSAPSAPSKPAGDRPDAGTSNDRPATEELRKLHDETNEIRKAAGKAPLKWDGTLAAESAKWSEKQLRDRKLHHDTGMTTGRYNAENVFMTQGGSAADAVQAWRKSPGHYRNMIGDYATEGIGIATDGKGTYYVTQRFNR